jgi:hypothetical protein
MWTREVIEEFGVEVGIEGGHGGIPRGWEKWIIGNERRSGEVES